MNLQEKEIIEETRRFAGINNIPFDEVTESMLLNAMREYLSKLNSNNNALPSEKNTTTSTQEVLDKYFKGERTIYFQSSDALNQIEGDTYLRYKKDGGVQIWFGGNNGEVCLIHTTNAQSLENVIKSIIYG